MTPSFVMWPMTNIATPDVLAQRSSAAAHSRICVTLPADDSTVSVYIVCIESMTTTCGRDSSICAMMFSNCVSGYTMHSSLAMPRRVARILICSADSSPET